MRFESRDGADCQLSVVRYQFASIRPQPDDWDANWLVVQGAITLSDGRRWRFADPCLTTWEALALEAWLRGIVAGEAVPASEPADEPQVIFVEPNLAFDVHSAADERITLAVYFSLEAAPPWLDQDERLELYSYSVNFDLSRDQLSNAVDDWAAEIAKFPKR